MSTATLPVRLPEPTRSRIVYAIRACLDEDLEALGELVDDLMNAEHPFAPTLTDARHHVLRLGQYLDALQALGPPDCDALYAAYQQ